MFKKVYENIKNYISKNIEELIFILGFYVFLTYPLPYYILTSGGTIDVSNRVEISDSYEQKGSFNLAYVNELKGTIPTYLLSFVIPDWTLYRQEEYTFDETEDATDVTKRDQLLLKESLQNSTKVAYEAAGKDFKINKTSYYIYYVEDFVKDYADIRVGDEIISYDDNKLTDIDAYRTYINSKKVDDEINVTIKRDNKTIKTKLKVYEEDGSKYTGIMVSRIYDYETDPEITFKFRQNESGPSAGLTLALAIYNKLTKEDITKGLKIVGTGTIESDGSVGEIGGVEYKLQGAVKANADIFIVPKGDNYETAKKIKEENEYEITLIEATTFEETLEKLKNYKK